MPATPPHHAHSDAEPRRMLRGRRILQIGWIGFVILAFDLVVGTAWHEIVGHGLTTMAMGARITYVEVLGFQLFPDITWVGATGYFGRCEATGIEGEAANAFILLSGSLSTWLVGVMGVCLLYLRPRRGWMRVLGIAISLWCFDLLLYTLPSLGIPRYFLWGHLYSEPYEAAVVLGVPGPVFQVFVIVASALLTLAIGRQILRAIREMDFRLS